MADYNSTQKAQIAANSSDLLRPAELHGRVRVASFDYTVPVGGVAINKTVALCDIPAGATILGGVLVHEDVGSKISIGVSDNVTKYLTATSMASASTTPVNFAHTVALKAGQRVTEKTEIIAKSLEGAWTAGKKFLGMVQYCVD
jgi:hypothetical protein